MPEGHNAQFQGTPSRILVVDDSTVIRQAIKKMLKADFDVVLADDGEQAWEKLIQDNQIKALITDIDMPRLDGYGLICRVRATEQLSLRDLPIITITGAEDEETKSRAYACGATDFITKPLDRLQLQARVHAYVKYDETARALTEKTVALEEEAVNDPLTQLRSKRYFLQRGEQDVAAGLRHEQDLSLVRLDIDDFKKIYRKYGDDVVDQLLIWLAAILVASARTEDTTARTGGAAFAIILPLATRAQALTFCDRLRLAINEKPFIYSGQPIAISVSMGLVTLSVDQQNSMDGMLKVAEQRLGYAQSQGGNRVSVATLSEVISGPEELTLTAPEEVVPAQTSLAIPPKVDPILDFIPFPEPASSATPSVEQLAVLELLSIDKALLLLQQGQAHKLDPYYEVLAQQVMPLLEAAAKKKGITTMALMAIITK